MNFKVTSALIGFTFAIGLGRRRRHHLSDQGVGGRRLQPRLRGGLARAGCLFAAQGKRDASAARQEEDECERGGCGPKAGKIQKQMNRKTQKFEAEQD